MIMRRVNALLFKIGNASVGNYFVTAVQVIIIYNRMRYEGFPVSVFVAAELNQSVVQAASSFRG